MSTTDGHWLVNLEGYPVISTDDLTLDELEVAETACGVPYTRMDPHRSVRIAKAMLAVVLMRANVGQGMPPERAQEEALKAVRRLPTRKLHHAFTYVPPTRPRPAGTEAPEDADPPLSAPTSVAG